MKYYISYVINYECTEILSEVTLESYDELEKAIERFIILSIDENSIDFSKADEIIKSWNKDESYIYCDDFYGGRLELACEYRTILTSYRQRDLESNCNTIYEIEFDNATKEEIEIFNKIYMD